MRISFQAIVEALVVSEPVNWVESDTSDLRLEYHVEYEIKPFVRGFAGWDVWPTFEDFARAYRRGRIETLTSVRGIERATGYKRLEDVLSLLRSYRSWPEFRNEKTFQAIVDGMQNGSPMKLPIIVETPGRERMVMSGNTRMNVAMILFGETSVKVIQVE